MNHKPPGTWFSGSSSSSLQQVSKGIKSPKLAKGRTLFTSSADPSDEVAALQYPSSNRERFNDAGLCGLRVFTSGEGGEGLGLSDDCLGGGGEVGSSSVEVEVGSSCSLSTMQRGRSSSLSSGLRSGSTSFASSLDVSLSSNIFSSSGGVLDDGRASSVSGFTMHAFCEAGRGCCTEANTTPGGGGGGRVTWTGDTSGTEGKGAGCGTIASGS